MFSYPLDLSILLARSIISFSALDPVFYKETVLFFSLHWILYLHWTLYLTSK